MYRGCNLSKGKTMKERITVEQMPLIKNENLIHLERYVKFINSRPERELNQRGYSTHHVYPRSIAKKNNIKDYDGNWNLIELTHREHFIAHMILFYCGYEEMMFAFHRMNNYDGNLITGKMYEKLRSEFAKKASATMKKYHNTHDLTGENAPNYGKRASIESRKKMSDSHLGQSPSNKGKQTSDKTKQKQREAKLGKVGNKKGKSVEINTRIKLRDANLGKRRITNGIVKSWLLKDSILPTGFYFCKKIKSKYAYRYIFSITIINIQSTTIFNKTKDFFITNGMSNRFISFDNKPPFGWRKGKTYIEESRWINNGIITLKQSKSDVLPEGFAVGSILFSGTTWYTNGIKNKHFRQNNTIPDGWRKGLTKETKNKYTP